MTTQTQFFAYSGAHFHECPIQLREAWAKVADPHLIHKLIRKIVPNNTLEFVPISTCNRFDICFFGEITEKQILLIFHELIAMYQSIYNCRIEYNYDLENPYSIKDYLRIHFNEHALHTLFKVTSSLDSLVIGESQIFGQIKSSFLKARQMGFAHKLAAPVFNKSFSVAKKIISETEINRNGISMGHAAIKIINQVFEDIRDKKILIVGAGEMVRVISQHLLASDVKSIFIANRTFLNAQTIATELGNIQPMTMSRALEKISEFDICIVACGGNDYLLTKANFENYSKKRNGEHAVFVDISVPRKIDPSISDINNLFLFNVDDLDSVMSQNRKSREKSAIQAEEIISSQVQEYLLATKQKENLTNVGKFHSWIKNVVNYEMDRVVKNINKGKQVDSNVVSEAIAKKMVSHAAMLARNNIKLEDNEDSVGELLEFLFQLSEQELLQENKLLKRH